MCRLYCTGCSVQCTAYLVLYFTKHCITQGAQSPINATAYVMDCRPFFDQTTLARTSLNYRVFSLAFYKFLYSYNLRGTALGQNHTVYKFTCWFITWQIHARCEHLPALTPVSLEHLPAVNTCWHLLKGNKGVPWLPAGGD